MPIRVALNHQTTYHYDRLVYLGPQIVRLRPAAHCRTPILSHSVRVQPPEHFENWQQDPHGNFQLRLVFPENVRQFRIEVDLVAEMTVINPFDFFVEPHADQFPFQYERSLAKEVEPHLKTEPVGPQLQSLLDSINRTSRNTVDFLVELNGIVQRRIRYLIRMEPGIQSCEQTLSLGSGSCRDSAWLLVQILRNLGLAARFVSGYLIQLVPDVKSLDGPTGPEQDFTDLHAWTEVYIPGAGWIGLDPTSGLLAGEGHIPLACTPDPSAAAPVTGGVGECETQFEFSMSVTRIHEDPRVTKPYSDDQWGTILDVGRQVDRKLVDGDVRLTMGGEPTFISIDDMDGEEWTTAAVGPNKRKLGANLLERLRNRFAPGALLHFGQGKWYPGEPLPRWALSCYWRNDGEPLWRNEALIADPDRDYGHAADDAGRFVTRLAQRLGVDPQYSRPAYEDVWHFWGQERKLPLNVSPRDSKLDDPEQRARMAKVYERGLTAVAGYVLPLKRQWWQAQAKWVSGPWPIRPEAMFLLPGDSPIGLRLPLDSLPWLPPDRMPVVHQLDPTAPRGPLPRGPGSAAQPNLVPPVTQRMPTAARQTIAEQTVSPSETDPSGIIHTALCIEPREGRLHVFMPPVERLEDYIDLVTAIEDTAAELETPVAVEGYLPPTDHRVQLIKVTPDPGVIEVNVHPSRCWEELVENTTAFYDEARLARLATEKFDLDGRHTGTGGGNHVVLGGPTPLDSPFLRRPDLLRSLIAFWSNHPSLSYLFSGSFVGPTSQAPRVDEGRRDALYELELAFEQVPEPGAGQTDACPPWLVDRIFRNLLVDVSGNTHRAEFCIDKLYSPDTATGRLGLVEFRAFEMPPHARMSVTQQLLLRACVARFWETPYHQKLVHWNTTLHDRFLLPHFVWHDFRDVIEETRQEGIALESRWFAPHFEFRFPMIGSVEYCGMEIELRQAIEPWYVLGEEPAGGGTVRYVDSSVERLQVRVRGMTGERYVITCNGRKLPLHNTGVEGEFVAGVRYRAWQPPGCLHPTVDVHSPLVFDVLDTWLGRSVGGCTYHVSHPAGRNYETFPVNAFEAEARRVARFFQSGHTGGPMTLPPDERTALYPLTLDLRRAVAAP